MSITKERLSEIKTKVRDLYNDTLKIEAALTTELEEAEKESNEESARLLRSIEGVLRQFKSIVNA